MSTVEEKIRNAASQNKELLVILSESDYGPPALEEQQKYIKNMNNERQQLESRIQNSKSSRLAYKVGGKSEKFDMKANKEEKEYFDVLHEEHQAKEHQKSLQHNLSEAQKQRTELEQVAATHKQAQLDLDALYDSIFEGPTPGFPEEDEKETAAQEALDSYHKLQLKFEAEERARTLIDEAQLKMADAIVSMREAESASQIDMVGGGMTTEVMKSNALSRAELYSSQASTLVWRAKRVSPHVGELDEVKVWQGNMTSNILFDNIFTDYNFYQKVKGGQEDMRRAAQMLQAEYNRCQQRVKTLNRQLKEEGRKLENARMELQSARIRAFKRIAGSEKY